MRASDDGSAPTRLHGRVQAYAWGSPVTLPRLLGTAADGAPQAELWLGSHPSAPARLGAPEGPPLQTSLPYLLKVLAVAAPLSLQAHPDAARAGQRYAAEQAGGLPADHPDRSYRDPGGKPELLVALEPVVALCGLLPTDEVAPLLARVPSLAPLTPTVGDGVLDLVARILRWPAEHHRRLVGEVAVAARALRREPAHAQRGAWLARLARLYPSDPGVALALLMHLVTLRPGQGLRLPPGQLHAYLVGTGIELMASSDNVLRGGLTPKRVDVPELLAVLQGTPTASPTVLDPDPDGPGLVTWRTPDPQFRLVRASVPAATAVPDRGPVVALCLAGHVQVSDVDLVRGQAAWVPGGDVPLTGAGQVWLASAGPADGGRPPSRGTQFAGARPTAREALRA